ncbi:MAG: hypothetical protein WBD70_14940, partial [Mycobacterium sp.]
MFRVQIRGHHGLSANVTLASESARLEQELAAAARLQGSELVAATEDALLPPKRPTRPTATPTPNASPKPSWPLIPCGRRCGARSCG